MTDLTGMTFGRLKVAKFAYRKSRDGKHYHYYWKCVCSCGNECVVRADALKRGEVQSCGCLQREIATAIVSQNHSHKMSETKIYRTWSHIKERCLNPNSKSYPCYGGRGIKVCAEWLDFQTFFDYVSRLEHFGEDGYTLDRIDNNKGYEAGNVKWSTRQEQGRNKRSNVVVEYEGEQMTLTEAAERSGINYGCLHHRIERGDTGGRLFRPKTNKSTATPN